MTAEVIKLAEHPLARQRGGNQSQAVVSQPVTTSGEWTDEEFLRELERRLEEILSGKLVPLEK